MPFFFDPFLQILLSFKPRNEGLPELQEFKTNLRGKFLFDSSIRLFPVKCTLHGNPWQMLEPVLAEELPYADGVKLRLMFKSVGKAFRSTSFAYTPHRGIGTVQYIEAQQALLGKRLFLVDIDIAFCAHWIQHYRCLIGIVLVEKRLDPTTITFVLIFQNL